MQTVPKIFVPKMFPVVYRTFSSFISSSARPIRLLNHLVWQTNSRLTDQTVLRFNRKKRKRPESVKETGKHSEMIWSENQRKKKRLTIMGSLKSMFSDIIIIYRFVYDKKNNYLLQQKTKLIKISHTNLSGYVKSTILSLGAIL